MLKMGGMVDHPEASIRAEKLEKKEAVSKGQK
jgi:hypothetical protein